MITILSVDGLIEIPEVYRKADALKPGQSCDIERVGEGEYHVRVGKSDTAHERKERLIDVLLSCPVKDWWVEAEDRERTSLEPPTLFSE